MAVRIMIKTNFIMRNERRLRLELGLGLFYIILNSPSPTGDVICSRFYLDKKNTEKKCQMNNPLISNPVSWLMIAVCFNKRLPYLVRKCCAYLTPRTIYVRYGIKQNQKRF